MHGPDGAPPVLAARNIAKSFGGARALAGVSLIIHAGEVHGLLGENGSGKSTLIKILSGFHAPEEGSELEVNGEPVELPLADGQFRALGFSFVHQDLGLVLDISVLENLFVDELVARRGLYISWKAERRRAAQVFERYGVDLDPAAPVHSLSPTERALLAIVRAVEGSRRGSSERERPGLLVLDEPTVFLPESGKRRLFEMVRSIVADNTASVLFVSHDLDEVRDVTDRVTVLRDGKVAGTVTTRDTSVPELVSLIVGRELDLLERHQAAEPATEVAYRVTGLSGGGMHDVSFDVRNGQIIGLTGLMGSGFEDVPYMLYGARPASDGTLETPEGKLPLTRMTPARALEAGIALIPADRMQYGCVDSLPVADNVTLSTLDGLTRRYGLSRRAMRESARQLVVDFDVRPPDPGALYQSLSGGNQQKAMMGKWLQTGPRLTLLHEPTQGVDIGARAQIFEMLRANADGGAAVICASSDYEQLAAICDRVLVFARRRIVDEIAGDDVTKDRIAHRVFGGD